MATYAFDIYPSDSPRAISALVRIDIGEFVSGWYKHVGHGIGEGQISIHSDHAAATEANFHKRAWVKFVRTDTGPEQEIGGFFLEEGDFTALSSQERGGRILTFGGPGGLAMLDRYVLGHAVYAFGQDHRGDYDVPDQWTWVQEPYGAMLARALDEGQNAPGAPLNLAFNFTRTEDSNGNAWDELGDYQTPIGTSVLEMYADFLRLGLVVQVTASMLVHAYRDIDEFRTDRTSATFAANKARFAAGVNIANELPKRIQPKQERTHVLIRDRTGDYQTIDEDLDGNPIDAEPYYTFLRSETTADDAAIVKMGKIHLTRRRQYKDQATVRHIIGAGTGEYAPGPEGDYWVLDLVTLHTGSDAHDFDEAPIEVASIKYEHDEAGNWFAETELGAQYVFPAVERFEANVTSSIRNINQIKLCLPNTTVAATAISLVGATRATIAGSGTISLPGGVATGDLVIVHAAYEGSGPFIPGLPADMTPIGLGGTAGGAVSGIGQRGSYKILQSSAETLGTWTDTLSLICTVWRGIDQADPIGDISGDDNASGELGWDALTLERSDSTSWVVAFGKHKTDTIVGDSMSGTAAMTSMSPTGTSDSGHHAWYSNGGVTTWGRHFVTTTNDDRLATAYEIRGGSAQTFSGDAHADLVGTGSRATRCDHAHHVFRDTAPTVNDDENDGYPNGTSWIRVNSLATPTSITATYRLLDNAAGAAVWVTEGAGAPTNADYLVGTANGSLSSEIVVGTTPGGELGGTWASPTVDSTHAGSNHLQPVRKNSAGSVFTRRQLNFIEGSNVTLTVADDAGNDEVDITIASSGTGGSIVVQEADSTVAAAASTLDFGTGFDITESPAGEANIDLDLLEVTAFTDHSARHETGGADAIKLDDLAAPDDNTDLNASTSAHGLLKKLSNTATEYMDGTGNWSTPAGSGGGISSGTSFPGSPSNNDLFYRTDRDLLYFYDGTRWLTVAEYDLGVGWVDTAAALSGTNTLARWPVRQDYGMYLTRWNVVTFMTNGTPASNNMTVVLARVNSSNIATTIASFVNNDAVLDAASTWGNHDQAIGAVLDSGARSLRVVATEAGTVTGFICAESVAYRLIG
jgi:hypothetical protein